MSYNTSNISEKQRTIIPDFFKTMNESSASLSYSNLAKQWLEKCGVFTGFIDGKWVPLSSRDETADIEIAKGLTATIKWASDNDIAVAIKSTQEGFKRWGQYEKESRSKILHRISHQIEQHSKLLNVVESLTKYGRIREKYNAKFLIDSFSYYAGMVETLLDGWKPTGVVCIICDNDTLVSSLWVLSALLAAGNAVMCLVNCQESLSPFLLAEICDSAGLPAGAFNVIPCQVSSLSNISAVDKIILSSPKTQTFLSGALNKNIPCEIIPSQWPSVVIYESADLDAAISTVLENLHIFDIKEPWPICKIYLQESIHAKFIDLMTSKISGALGNNISYRPPFYFMSSGVTIAQVQDCMLTYHSTDTRFQIICKSTISEGENQNIPSVILDFDTKVTQDQSKRCGPGVYIEQFRTVKESVAMFNQNKKNSSVSIWSEDMYLSLEVASKLKSRTVWINCLNIYEPSVTNGSLYLSGNSNIGGQEGVFSHLLSFDNNKTDLKCLDSKEIQSYGSEAPSSSIIPIKGNEEKKIEKCYKLFIGGSFVNSNGDSFEQACDANNKPYAYVASANKSDVDKAVSSASSSQPKWESMLKTKRAAILRKASEILIKRREEFESELCAITGKTKEFCSTEIKLTVSILQHWANNAAHSNGQIVETNFYGKVFQEYHPLGVIGIQCPDMEPLLSFVFLITPAIIFGNSVVAISSEKYPTCALKMCEVFQAAGLPGGVLNVVSSSRPYLTRHLSSHLNIDAVWFTEDGASFIYDTYHSIQPKKIFNCKNMANSLNKTKESKFLLESTYSKAIFMPMGTGFT